MELEVPWIDEVALLFRVVPEIILGGGWAVKYFSVLSVWGAFALKFFLWVVGVERKSVLGIGGGHWQPPGHILKLQVCPVGGVGGVW